MGTMASMAGKTVSDIVRRCFSASVPPNEVLLPGFVWWSGFQCCCFYYVCVYILPILSAEEALGVMRCLLVGHALLSNLVEANLDFTMPFRRIFLLLTRLPNPQNPIASKTSDSEGDNKDMSKKNK